MGLRTLWRTLNPPLYTEIVFIFHDNAIHIVYNYSCGYSGMFQFCNDELVTELDHSNNRRRHLAVYKNMAALVFGIDQWKATMPYKPEAVLSVCPNIDMKLSLMEYFCHSLGETMDL